MAYLLGLLLTAQLVQSADLSTGERIAYCQRQRSGLGIKTLAADPWAQFAFQNKGGFKNMGVCWWHAMLQRSALYLTAYKPEAPKPNKDEVLRILDVLKSNAAVVVIPGYYNFHDFTAEQEPIIQDYLNRWQIEDTVLWQEWIGNLASPDKLHPSALRIEMERIYDEVMNQEKLSWVMIAMPGIKSHAWIVKHIDRDDKGMTLWILDSNHIGQIRSERYDYGTEYVSVRDFGQGVPYLRRSYELKLMDVALTAYCQLGLK